MTDLVAVLRSMLPPLRVEYRTGCLNNAAIGGFDQHLLSLVREALPLAAGQPAEPHLRRMAEILAAYRGLDLATRAKRLREIKRRLDALL
ncbi:MAG: hypothetical protein HUU35_11185, partial [Armatimonadetes bacterium]|nr:hypothetical protein [Armatimonadota bacterium]